MAKLFSGYAQSRGFRPTQSSSKSRQISSRSDALLREQQRERDYIKEQAVKTDNANNSRFQLEQEQNQIYQDLEVQAAEQEKNVKMDTYEAEMRRIDSEQKERTDVFQALSGISTTAAKILQEELVKRKEAEINLSQSLTMQYGIDAKELGELQALEGGLSEFNNQQAPIITRLRASGASEKDINTLMQKSGWNAYGAQLGAVQNAAANYDLYLADKYDEDVVINGVPMSLASAEMDNDAPAVAGIINRHRNNFINEYLPGYDSAFIAKHARETFTTAESRRKKTLAEQIEKKAGAANMAQDRAMTITNIRQNLTDPRRYHDKIETDAGGLDSDVLGVSHERNYQHLLNGAQTGAISGSTVRDILDEEVYIKHLNKVAPYREGFPTKARELENAIDDQEERQRSALNRVNMQKTEEAEQMYSAIINEFKDDPDSITEDAIEKIQNYFRDNYAHNGGVELANKLAHYTDRTPKALNDKAFDDFWATEKKLGRFPTAGQIMAADLSREKRASELVERNERVEVGLDEETLEGIDTEVKAILEKRIDLSFSDPTTSGLVGMTAALAEANNIFLENYRYAYKGNKQEAIQHASAVLTEKISLTKNSDKTDTWFIDGDQTFPYFGPKKKDNLVPTQAEAVRDHIADGTSYQRKLYVDAERLKRSVKRINQGETYDFPVEIYTINRELGGRVPLSEIYLDQLKVARQEKPELNIPDVIPGIEEIWQPMEKAIDKDLLQILQNYPSQANADRALVGSDMPPIYERSEPIISFYKLLEPYNVRPELMPIFGAVMMGESAGDPKIDTYQSGTDREMKNEYSIGLLQVNTFDHMDKLNRKGYSKDDLRNPVKNIEIAMEVWEEWIQVLMNQDPTMTREEAEVSALDRWGAYGHASKGNKGEGPYLDHLDKARDMYRRFEAEKTKNTWEQSIHMNQYARDWIDQLEQSGGAWIG